MVSDMYFINNICCLCLSESNELISLFNDNKSVNNVIQHVLPTIPFYETSVPTYVCTPCFTNIEAAFAFQNECIKTYYKWREYVEKLRIKHEETYKDLKIFVYIKNDDENEENICVGTQEREIFEIPEIQIKFSQDEEIVQTDLTEENAKEDFLFGNISIEEHKVETCSNFELEFHNQENVYIKEEISTCTENNIIIEDNEERSKHIRHDVEEYERIINSHEEEISSSKENKIIIEENEERSTRIRHELGEYEKLINSHEEEEISSSKENNIIIEDNEERSTRIRNEREEYERLINSHEEEEEMSSSKKTNIIIEDNEEKATRIRLELSEYERVINSHEEEEIASSKENNIIIEDNEERSTCIRHEGEECKGIINSHEEEEISLSKENNIIIEDNEERSTRIRHELGEYERLINSHEEEEISLSKENNIIIEDNEERSTRIRHELDEYERLINYQEINHQIEDNITPHITTTIEDTIVVLDDDEDDDCIFISEEKQTENIAEEVKIEDEGNSPNIIQECIAEFDDHITIIEEENIIGIPIEDQCDEIEENKILNSEKCIEDICNAIEDSNSVANEEILYEENSDVPIIEDADCIFIENNHNEENCEEENLHIGDFEMNIKLNEDPPIEENIQIEEENVELNRIEETGCKLIEDSTSIENINCENNIEERSDEIVNIEEENCEVKIIEETCCKLTETKNSTSIAKKIEDINNEESNDEIVDRHRIEEIHQIEEEDFNTQLIEEIGHKRIEDSTVIENRNEENKKNEANSNSFTIEEIGCPIIDSLLNQNEDNRNKENEANVSSIRIEENEDNRNEENKTNLTSPRTEETNFIEDELHQNEDKLKEKYKNNEEITSKVNINSPRIEETGSDIIEDLTLIENHIDCTPIEDNYEDTHSQHKTEETFSESEKNPLTTEEETDKIVNEESQYSEDEDEDKECYRLKLIDDFISQLQEQIIGCPLIEDSLLNQNEDNRNKENEASVASIRIEENEDNRNEENKTNLTSPRTEETNFIEDELHQDGDNLKEKYKNNEEITSKANVNSPRIEETGSDIIEDLTLIENHIDCTPIEDNYEDTHSQHKTEETFSKFEKNPLSTEEEIDKTVNEESQHSEDEDEDEEYYRLKLIDDFISQLQEQMSKLKESIQENEEDGINRTVDEENCNQIEDNLNTNEEKIMDTGAEFCENVKDYEKEKVCDSIEENLQIEENILNEECMQIEDNKESLKEDQIEETLSRNEETVDSKENIKELRIEKFVSSQPDIVVQINLIIQTEENNENSKIKEIGSERNKDLMFSEDQKNIFVDHMYHKEICENGTPHKKDQLFTAKQNDEDKNKNDHIEERNNVEDHTYDEQIGENDNPQMKTIDDNIAEEVKIDIEDNDSENIIEECIAEYDEHAAIIEEENSNKKILNTENNEKKTENIDFEEEIMPQRIIKLKNVRCYTNKRKNIKKKFHTQQSIACKNKNFLIIPNTNIDIPNTQVVEAKQKSISIEEENNSSKYLLALRCVNLDQLHYIMSKKTHVLQKFENIVEELMENPSSNIASSSKEEKIKPVNFVQRNSQLHQKINISNDAKNIIISEILNIGQEKMCEENVCTAANSTKVIEVVQTVVPELEESITKNEERTIMEKIVLRETPETVEDVTSKLEEIEEKYKERQKIKAEYEATKLRIEEITKEKSFMGNILILGNEVIRISQEVEEKNEKRTEKSILGQKRKSENEENEETTKEKSIMGKIRILENEVITETQKTEEKNEESTNEKYNSRKKRKSSKEETSKLPENEDITKEKSILEKIRILENEVITETQETEEKNEESINVKYKLRKNRKSSKEETSKLPEYEENKEDTIKEKSILERIRILENEVITKIEESEEKNEESTNEKYNLRKRKSSKEETSKLPEYEERNEDTTKEKSLLRILENEVMTETEKSGEKNEESINEKYKLRKNRKSSKEETSKLPEYEENKEDTTKEKSILKILRILENEVMTEIEETVEKNEESINEKYNLRKKRKSSKEETSKLPEHEEKNEESTKEIEKELTGKKRKFEENETNNVKKINFNSQETQKDEINNKVTENAVYLEVLECDQKNVAELIKIENKNPPSENIVNLKTQEDAIDTNKKNFKIRKIHRCLFCGSNYANINEANVHILTHKVLKCRFCVYNNTTRADLFNYNEIKFHNQVYHAEKSKLNTNKLTRLTKICSICAATFKNLQSLRKHLSTHLNWNKQCETCNIPIPRDLYSRHLETFHRLDLHFECYLCTVRFNSKYSLVTHSEQHIEINKCPICFKEHNKRQEFIEHMKKCPNPKTENSDFTVTKTKLNKDVLQYNRKCLYRNQQMVNRTLRPRKRIKYTEPTTPEKDTNKCDNLLPNVLENTSTSSNPDRQVKKKPKSASNRKMAASKKLSKKVIDSISELNTQFCFNGTDFIKVVPPNSSLNSKNNKT